MTVFYFLILPKLVDITEQTPSNSLIKVSTVFSVVSGYVWLRPDEPEQIPQLDTEEILKWLDEVWLDPEVREGVGENVWLEFVESVKSELQ